jgi:hypothetical protein
MAVFMIGYDLHEGEDYEDLIKAIQSLDNGWWHCLDSTWFIRHAGPANTILNTLRPHIKNYNSKTGDKLLVLEIQVQTNWSCTNSLPDDCIEWLRSNIAR